MKFTLDELAEQAEEDIKRAMSQRGLELTPQAAWHIRELADACFQYTLGFAEDVLCKPEGYEAVVEGTNARILIESNIDGLATTDNSLLAFAHAAICMSQILVDEVSYMYQGQPEKLAEHVNAIFYDKPESAKSLSLLSFYMLCDAWEEEPRLEQEFSLFRGAYDVRRVQNQKAQ